MKNQFLYLIEKKDNNYFLEIKVPFNKKHKKIFAKYGHTCSAYGWQSILNEFIGHELRNDELLPQITFDSDNDNFIAFSKSEQSLNELLDIIVKLNDNDEELSDILESLDEEEFEAFSFLPCELESGEDDYYGVLLEVIYDNEYKTLFEKYGIDHNGYNWQVVLVSYLEKEKPDFLEEINFDSESSTCVVYAPNKEIQYEIARVFHRIYKDYNLVEEILKNTPRRDFFD